LRAGFISSEERPIAHSSPDEQHESRSWPKTLRDMIPNHVFTLLSRVAMEPPVGFFAAMPFCQAGAGAGPAPIIDLELHRDIGLDVRI
jgi:hypothetical protein